MNTSGHLELFVGPMYSGKTSKLLDLYKKYTFCNIPTLVINYAEDKRYSDTMLSNHNKEMIPCINVYTLSAINNNNNLYKLYSNASIVLINEAQFFEDIVEWVTNALNIDKKNIYLSGLDGDFKRNKFGNWLDLIPLCDNITKCKAYCSICKLNDAIFTHRISKETQQKVIGNDNYVALCRMCYNKTNSTS